MKDSMLKSLGLIATVVGFGATIVGSMIGDKQMDNKIAAKVAKALAEKE